jgi:RHS repeat-associated protein
MSHLVLINPEATMKKAWRYVISLALMLACTAASTTSTIVYYHNDIAGSPVVATDASGQVLWRESYRPYGERLTNSAASTGNDVWFTSRRQDADTGLVYMGARYYDPVIGRFMATDPAGFDEKNLHSFNRYAYANNNPLRYRDPDGRNPRLLWLAGKGAYDAANIAGLGVLGGMLGAAAWDIRQRILNAQTADEAGGNKPDSTKGGEGGERGSNAGANRPAGIPEHWVVGSTDKGGGREWVDPDNSGNRVRVYPGNPGSSNPAQQEPYVRDVRNGNQWLDVNGNRIEGREGRNSPATHIPEADYVFRP